MIFKIIIALIIVEIIWWFFKNKKLSLLLKLLIVTSFIVISINNDYINKYSDYKFVINWDYFINDIKIHFDKYLFCVKYFFLYIIFIYLFIEVLKYVIKYFSDKIDITNTKFNRIVIVTILTQLNTDGQINIENGSIVKDDDTNKIKNEIKKVKYYSLLYGQSFTTLIILFSIFIINGLMFKVFIYIILIAHILLSIALNNSIKKLRHINKVL